MHPRDKSRLYHDLGELIKSGMTLPRAVEKLAQHARGSSVRVLRGISAELARGRALSEAARGQPGVTEMDAALFAATERAGKLEHGFALASEYYASVAEARGRILRKIAYPIFVAHLAVVVFSLTGVIGQPNWSELIFRRAVMGFGMLWSVIFGAGLIIAVVRQQAARSVALDRLLTWVPMIGGMRRDLALSRFSAAYDMQLEAGVNVFGALEASGRASASAAIRHATRQAVEDVRAGEPVSTALVATRVFPERFLRAFMVGEESGRLDQELRALSEEYRVGGLRKMETLSEWLPRFIFIAVMVMVAWKVVSFYAGYLQSINQLMQG